MIIKDSENKVHRYSNKTNWKSKRRNEILRQIFPMAAVAAAAVILVALSFVQKKETGETSAACGFILSESASALTGLVDMRIFVFANCEKTDAAKAVVNLLASME